MVRSWVNVQTSASWNEGQYPKMLISFWLSITMSAGVFKRSRIVNVTVSSEQAAYESQEGRDQTGVNPGFHDRAGSSEVPRNVGFQRHWMSGSLRFSKMLCSTRRSNIEKSIVPTGVTLQKTCLAAPKAGASGIKPRQMPRRYAAISQSVQSQMLSLSVLWGICSGGTGTAFLDLHVQFWKTAKSWASAERTVRATPRAIILETLLR